MGLDQKMWIFKNREDFEKFTQVESNYNKAVEKIRQDGLYKKSTSAEERELMYNEDEKYSDAISRFVIGQYYLRNVYSVHDWMCGFYPTSAYEDYIEFNFDDLLQAAHKKIHALENKEKNPNNPDPEILNGDEDIADESLDGYYKNQLQEIVDWMKVIKDSFGEDIFAVYRAY